MRTRRQLEDWMKRQPALRFPRQFGAENAALPSMIGIYWRLTDALDGYPPEQMDFASQVVREANSVIGAHVLARACRTYPSLVRQHHLIPSLQEGFPRVIWSTEWDHTGIDISVAYRGLSIAIASAANTPRSHQWEPVKERRHPVGGDVHLLRLYAERGEYEVGPFWLHHPQRAIEQVRAFGDAILSKRGAA